MQKEKEYRLEWDACVREMDVLPTTMKSYCFDFNSAILPCNNYNKNLNKDVRVTENGSKIEIVAAA